MSQATQETQPKTQEPSAEVQSIPVHFGGIPASWDEKKLYDFIIEKQPDIKVGSMRLVCDWNTKKSRRYAYINLPYESSVKLINEFNHMVIDGNEVKVSLKRTDKPLPDANLFANNMNKETTYKEVEKKFGEFGDVLSTSKREFPNKSAFCIQYKTTESANKAIEALNGHELDGQTITVSVFVPASKRAKAFTNVLVKNIPEKVSEEDLKKKFSQFGTITSLYIFKKEDGTVAYKESDGNKVYQAAINFKTTEEAHAAIANMNGTNFEGSEIIVLRHLTKKQRKSEYKKNSKSLLHSPECNLFLNGVDTVDEIELRNKMQQFGNIDSLRLMLDENNKRRAYGYCSFFDKESAEKAITEGSVTVSGVPVTITKFRPKAMRVRSNYVRFNGPRRSVGNKPFNKRAQQKRAQRPQQVTVEQKQEPVAEIKIEPIAAEEFSKMSDEEKHEILGEKIYDFVSTSFEDANAGKITGMILESFKTSLDKLNAVIEKGEINEKINEAIEVLKKHNPTN